MNQKWKLIWLSFFSSLFYCCFINPLTTEHLEFAQTLAGLVPINENNQFYIIRQSDPSLQVFLPALLLKLGISKSTLWALSSFVSEFIPILGFQLLVYFFTGHVGIALISCFPLLGSVSPYFHFYNVSFPADFYVFGNFGMFFLILSLSLYLNDFKKIAFLFFGLLFSVHLVWAFAGIPFFGKYLYQEEKRKNLFLYMFLGLSLSGASYKGSHYFYEHYFQASIEKTTQNVAPNLNSKSENSKVLDLEKSNMSQNPPESKKRTTFQAHNPQLWTGQLNKDLEKFLELMKFSVYFLIFSWAAVKLRILKRVHIQKISKPYFLLCFGVLILLGLIEINDVHPYLGFINSFILRAIPNRWLNLSFAFSQILFISVLSNQFLKEKYQGKLFILSVAYLFYKKPYFDIFALSLLFVLYFNSEYFSKKLNSILGKDSLEKDNAEEIK